MSHPVRLPVRAGSAPAASTRTGRVRVHSDISDAAWDAYVERHPGASGYLLTAWTRIIATAFRHRVCRLVAESDRGIEGVLPLVLFRSRLFGRFAVSLPFLNYGGIIAESPDVERALLDGAIQECLQHGARHLELRHTWRHFADLPCKRHKVAMTLQLEKDPDSQSKALDRKVRNQIRKAEKSGMRTVAGGRELVPPFYEVFARNMRDLGTPVYAMRFFEEVVGTLPDHTRVFCVYAGTLPVAASIVHVHRDTVEVPWASSLREFSAQAPNMLLYWQMLQFAIGRSARRFDFGRSTPGEGTFHFKRQWGAVPQELVWEYWTAPGAPMPDLSPANPGFRRAIALWQRLPVPLTKLVGPPIVRNIP